MAIDNILALDVGSVRVGVAYAGDGLRMARRVTTLDVRESFWRELQSIIDEYQAGLLVIGMPRGLDGQETDQSRFVQRFAEECKEKFGLPIHFQDEALTSVRAKEILGNQKHQVDKKEVDAIAASLILSDYLEEHKQ